MAGLKKLMAYGLFTVLTPKFFPFPFFIPPFLLGMILCIYFAEKGTVRYVTVALVAFQFAPYGLVKTKDLKDIESWGNQGSTGNKGPLKGVYLFDGLPAATIDFSQCLWHAPSKTQYCHLPKVHSVWPDFPMDFAGAGFPPTADGGGMGPSQEEMNQRMPWPVFFMFYHVGMHNRIDFHFNEDLTEAMVYENTCLAVTASPSPLAYLFPYGICTSGSIYWFFRMFTIVKDKSDPPVWYRNTYFQEKSLLNLHEPIKVSDKQARSGGTVYPAKMVYGDGYRIVPLLTPDAKGKSVLHKGNLARALKLGSKVLMRDM